MAHNPYYPPPIPPQQQPQYPQYYQQPQNIYQQLGKPQPQPHLQRLPSQHQNAYSYTPAPQQHPQYVQPSLYAAQPQQQYPAYAPSPAPAQPHIQPGGLPPRVFAPYQQPQLQQVQPLLQQAQPVQLYSRSPSIPPPINSSVRVGPSPGPPIAPSATLAQQVQQVRRQDFTLSAAPIVQQQPQPIVLPSQGRRPLPQPSPGANAKPPTLPSVSDLQRTPTALQRAPVSANAGKPFPPPVKTSFSSSSEPNSSNDPSPTRASRPLPTPGSKVVITTATNPLQQPPSSSVTSIKRAPSPVKSSVPSASSAQQSIATPTKRRASPPRFQTAYNSAQSSPVKENPPPLNQSELPYLNHSPPASKTMASITSVSTTNVFPQQQENSSPPKKFTPIWKRTIPDYPTPVFGYAAGMVKDPWASPAQSVASQSQPNAAQTPQSSPPRTSQPAPISPTKGGEIPKAQSYIRQISQDNEGTEESEEEETESDVEFTEESESAESEIYGKRRYRDPQPVRKDGTDRYRRDAYPKPRESPRSSKFAEPKVEREKPRRSKHADEEKDIRPRRKPVQEPEPPRRRDASSKVSPQKERITRRDYEEGEDPADRRRHRSRVDFYSPSRSPSPEHEIKKSPKKSKIVSRPEYGIRDLPPRCSAGYSDEEEEYEELSKHRTKRDLRKLKDDDSEDERDMLRRLRSVALNGRGSRSSNSSLPTKSGRRDYFDNADSRSHSVANSHNTRGYKVAGETRRSRVNLNLDDSPPRSIRSPSPIYSKRSTARDMPAPMSRGHSHSQLPNGSIVARPKSEINGSQADVPINPIQRRRSLYSANSQYEEPPMKSARPRSQMYGPSSQNVYDHQPVNPHRRSEPFASHEHLPQTPAQRQQPHYAQNQHQDDYSHQPQYTASSLPSAVNIESPAPIGGRDKRADLERMSEGADSENGDREPSPQIPTINISSSPQQIPMISISPSYEETPDRRAPPNIPQINIAQADSSQGREGRDVPKVHIFEVPGISVSSSDNGTGMPVIYAPNQENQHPRQQQQQQQQMRPVARGGLICGGCHGSIIGRIVSAMGARWHPGCFQCTVCKELLEHVSSYEHDGRPYCHLDYHENFAPRCYSCKTAIIEERFISLDDPALGKRTYHEQHFFCAECGDPFLSPNSFSNETGELALGGDGEFEGFTVYKGHPYCEPCHVRLRLPKCKRCKRSIRDGDQAVEALGGKWCWSCFVCASCEKPFDDPSFFQRDDKPFCEHCFSIILRNEI